MQGQRLFEDLTFSDSFEGFLNRPRAESRANSYNSEQSYYDWIDILLQTHLYVHV